MYWQIQDSNYQSISEWKELEEAVAKALRLLEDKGYDQKQYVAGVEPRNWEGSKNPVRVGLYRRGLMGGRISSGYSIFPIKP